MCTYITVIHCNYARFNHFQVASIVYYVYYEMYKSINAKHQTLLHLYLTIILNVLKPLQTYDTQNEDCLQGRMTFKKT